MFSAPFTSALNATLHGSQTDSPRSTLTIIFLATRAARLARIFLRYFHEFNTSEFRLVFEDASEAVEHPHAKVQIAVLPAVFCLAIFLIYA